MIHGQVDQRLAKMSTDPALIKTPEQPQPHQDRMTRPAPTRGTTGHQEHQASSSSLPRTEGSESRHVSLAPLLALPSSSSTLSLTPLPPPPLSSSSSNIYINPTTTHHHHSHHFLPVSHHHHHPQHLRPHPLTTPSATTHLMDPNRYHQGGYYPPTTTSSDEAADQSAWAVDEFNHTLMINPPDTIIDDPSWYTSFDYSADPADYSAGQAAYWDTPASGGYETVAAGTSGGHNPSSSSRKANASSSKGKGKSKDSSSPSHGGSGQVEYRFKTDLPEAADWEAQKETIKGLYLTGKRSLRDVTEIMKDQYGFYATERMYKHQFKKWNWHKYKSKDRK